jgi:hypothetical protein
VVDEGVGGVHSGRGVQGGRGVHSGRGIEAENLETHKKKVAPELLFFFRVFGQESTSNRAPFGCPKINSDY